MVMTEYDDCVQRAERLASAHDACLAGKPVRLGLVKDEDVNIYLRHLVLTEQSWRDPSAFLAVSRDGRTILLVRNLDTVWLVHCRFINAVQRNGVNFCTYI